MYDFVNLIVSWYGISTFTCYALIIGLEALEKHRLQSWYNVSLSFIPGCCALTKGPANSSHLARMLCCVQLAVHCAKNYMHKALSKIKVPLILGVWGGKGQGKTFQVTLAFTAMNVEPIIMSAGELEAGQAGEPAKLVRQRYREAGDFLKKNQMSALFINDLDAGAGRLGESTQYTVNNQMVNATLMNIADNPTNVQLPGVYKSEECPRVPVIVTGVLSSCGPVLWGILLTAVLMTMHEFGGFVCLQEKIQVKHRKDAPQEHVEAVKC